MINTFKTIVEVALNKNQMGKSSPSEFNHAVEKALIKNYAKLFSDYRKLNYKKSRFQDTSNYGSESEYRKQAMEYYVVEQSLTEKDGVIVMPKDLYLIDVDGLFNETTNIEKVDKLVFETLKRMNRNKPSNCTPIFTYNNGILKVFPVQKGMSMNYFRKHKPPKWTYKVIDGIETFNPDAKDFQDIDCHPLMYHNIFVDTLQTLGLNIKEEFALQYVSQLKQEEQINAQ